VRVGLLGADLASVQVDDPLGDREPEPGAAVRGRAGLVGAVEALEHALGLRRRDARAAIEDLEPRVAVPPGGADEHARAGRRVADRVRDEVAEHLLQAMLVGVENERRLDGRLERDLAVLGARPPLADDAVEELRGREARARERRDA
jgi:hypothetical protein